MWGRRALSIDMSQKSGVPRKGEDAAEEVGVQGVQRGKSCCKELQQLLEVERTRVKKEGEGVKGIKGEGKGRRKSGEAHNVTSKSSVDEDRFRKGKHP